MKCKPLFAAMLAAVMILTASIAIAAEEESKEKTANAKPVYVPPARGAPASRVGGGTRGAEDQGTILRVLAPDHTGLSSRDQPVLYWFLSQPAETRLEITLVDDNTIKPLLDITMDVARTAGIQAVDLLKHGVHLKPDIEYQWSVALVVDPEQRSKDVLASGTIMYAPPSKDFESKVRNAHPVELATVYAAGGYWYDALSAISARIDAVPGDAELREQRAALLDQVELPEVAGFERRQIAR